MQIEKMGFKTIPGYPLYEINNRGDIRRLWKNAKKTLLKPALKRCGYTIRLLDSSGIRRELRVHKLMQHTFMRTPKLGEVLYHKNGNKLDNWINNLAYITRQELGKMTGGQSRQSVLKIDTSGEVVEIYRSARAAGKENFMSYQTIIDRCNGKVKKKIAPDGFIYEWEDEFSCRYKKSVV
ncbi:MAG TPA: NUMOD4 motif-containing HNH endonuclease [Candidatus Paenibacillus intestinavium]|nr:NUMOD4 motif-containing HNH endonuclease [Candidatus Paenibacillus intestinavium]